MLRTDNFLYNINKKSCAREWPLPHSVRLNFSVTISVPFKIACFFLFFFALVGDFRKHQNLGSAFHHPILFFLQLLLLFSLLFADSYSNMYGRSIRVVHASVRQGAKLNHLKVAQRNLVGLTIGVPKEVMEGEGRVALTPPHVVKLIKAGAAVKIESGSGDIAGFPDSTFTAAGAEIASVDDVWKQKVVAKVRK
jgi:hypothetical protein